MIKYLCPFYFISWLFFILFYLSCLNTWVKLPPWKLKTCLYSRLFEHEVWNNFIFKFNIHGSVHRKYIPKYIQQDATLHSLFISGNCSICFGWYLHPSSGAHTTVSTPSGICHAVTTTYRYRGRVGTGLSVLWSYTCDARIHEHFNTVN